MMNWSLISGGRCDGKPWRVGVVGFSTAVQKAFVLSDMDWAGMGRTMPLEPLMLYGESNGFLFERVVGLDSLDYDGLLLITHDWQEQPVFEPAPSMRQYLVLVQEHQRSTLEKPAAFAQVFAPQVPGHGDEWIYLDSRISVDPECSSPNEWALFPPPKLHEIYHLSADYWLNRVTAAIALDVAEVRNVRPLMSVVIPCYNYGRFIHHCVQSVLDQGLESLEILVLDNASTDETPQVMASFAHDSRVRYMRNRYNCGAAYNWEKGRLIAKGRYFTFLSADDYFNEGHLARLLPVLEANPQVAVGYTSIRWVDEQGLFLAQPRHPGYRTADYVGGRNEVVDLLVHDNYMTPSAVIHRRDLFYKIWRPVQTLGAGDWDMAIQMAEQYPDFAYIDTPGVSYRWHGAQYSQQHFYTSTAPLADHLTIVEGVFQRNAQHHLKGREREVAAHIERRLARYPGELHSPLGDRARALMGRLETLAQFNEAPLFSIVLTTYNRPALLKDALASIDSQTLRDFEVILVNDHGDPVEALLEQYRFSITYLRQGRNQGPAAARNAAHRLARGRYLVYLDDDDLFLPEHLQTLAGALEANPDEVVYSDALFIAERIESASRHVLGEERRYPHESYSHKRLLVDNYIPINTFAWPRALVAEVGGFDERLSGLEDWDFLLRLAARVTFHHVRQDTVQVRMRVEGQERRSQQALKDYAQLYRKIYARYPTQSDQQVEAERTAKLKALDSAAGTKEVVESWLSRRTLSAVQRRLVEERLQQREGPSFGVLILDVQGNSDKLSNTLASLQQLEGIAGNVQPVVLTVAQRPVAVFSGQLVRVTAGNWAESLNGVLRAGVFDWVAFVRAGDEFTANGLLMASLELLAAPECRALYCDEMYRQADGNHGAALRPAFNLDYLLSFPVGMAHHWLFRRDVLIEAGGFDADFPEALEFELVLRLINMGGLAGLGHVAEPLLITDAPVLADVEDEQRAIIRHLQGRGYEQAQVFSPLPGRYQIRYGHPEQPFVSLLIIAGTQLARLQRCVESLLERTDYPHYELLLIESDSSARDTHDWLKALEGLGEARLRVVWPAAAVASAGLNQAVAHAHGDYLLLLSPDVAVIEGDWLAGLVNHAQRPEVGAVGAKLLSADGKVQHAGVILGLDGVVGSPFQGEPLDAPGYMQRLQVDQNYCAVSGDCLLVRKELFIEAGGLDEEPLLAKWSDVDLCLRLQQAGYLNVWTPHVQLLSDASTGRESTPREEDAFFAKWLPLLARDPAYNPGFSLQRQGSFTLAPTELSWRPLQSWRPVPRVLAHPADGEGCGHYRVMQPHRALREQGLIEGDVAPLLLSVVDLERYDPDVIILQRQITDERLESMRRMGAFSRAFKIYELDDYLPNLPLKSVHREGMPKDILKSLRRGFSLVDRMVVSTEALAEAYAGMHHDIRVVENRLPLDWWQGLGGKRRAGSRPRVGWAGGISHTGDLELIADVVKELAGEVEWVFFGMCPDRLRPYISEFHPGVQIESYPQALARLNLDLALAPVEQNLFNECKSNLRLLEYGACGFPVICSDVRCYQGDALPVTRVKNRFRDWVDAIRSHINDLDAAARAGDDLRAAVLGGWMLEGENLEAWRKAWLPG
jgi:GT2 family glycosyltransferase